MNVTVDLSDDEAVAYDSYGLIFDVKKTTSAAGGFAFSFSNIKATAVPEPSAFGLLAGIGALALVASRRRRK